MALGTFIAGAYVGSFTKPGGSPLLLGITLSGFTIGHRVYRERLDRSDVFGRMTVEQFDLGLIVNVSSVFHERKQAVLNILHPWQAIGPTGAQSFVAPTIGAQASDQAGSLILTVTASTPSATNGPATITVPHLVLDSDFPVELAWNAEHMTLPFRGEAMPYLVSTTVTFFTST